MVDFGAYANNIAEMWDIFDGIRNNESLDNNTIELADSICRDLDSVENNIRKLEGCVTEKAEDLKEDI